MRTTYSIVSIMVLLITFGCYKDKGNYDYKTLPRPLISGIDKRYDIFVGDKLIIKPEIIFQEGKPTVKNAEYSWIIDTKEVSKERDLDIVVNLTPGARKYATYTVKDLDNDVSTIFNFEIWATSMFKQGWVILSEVDGKGYLCYQRPDDVFYEDIYGSINGEELSTSPMKLREHWLPWSSEMGQINVVCKGAPNYSVELDGASFSKVIYNKQEFVGDKEPEGFAPINAWYVSGYDILLNADGKIYTRNILSGTSAKYQEELFADIPYIGDYELSEWSMRGSPLSDNEILSYDKKNKRYVIITDGVVSSINTSKDVNKAFAVENMTKEVIAGGVNAMESPRAYFVSVLKDFNDGHFYMHRFYMSGWRAPRVFYSTSETKMEDGGFIAADSKFVVCVDRPYVFFTNGGKLYRYNIDTNQVPEFIKDYGKKITAIALNMDSSVLGMVLGDSNNGNDFVTADVSIIGSGKILTEQKGVCGKGIDIIYKVGDQWEFPM